MKICWTCTPGPDPTFRISSFAVSVLPDARWSVLTVFNTLPSNSLHQEQQYMLSPAEKNRKCCQHSPKLQNLDHTFKNTACWMEMWVDKRISVSYRLFGVVTRLVVVSNLYSRSRRAAFCPAIRVLHLHFSQQSQYAVGDVLFSLANMTVADEYWHTWCEQ